MMSEPVKTIRFVMIGGFLGAGKTTTLARLARHYTSKGLNVGIVTNDQAADLVDTQSLRAQGFLVGEVAGACFCCRFDNLVQTMEGLTVEQSPDVILAEPVGSCTDLVATVIQPMRQLHQAFVSVAPYAVLLKPHQARKLLRKEGGTGFSPKAAYIFEKQLEEADLILVNRADELKPEELQDLLQLLEEKHPTTRRLAISAKTGAGFPELLEFLDLSGDFGRRVLDIDYDVYAEGEAELGWLNSSLQVKSDQPFDLDSLLTTTVERLQKRFAERGFEAAHLKVIGLWEGFFGVANLISTSFAAELSLPSRCQATTADVVVNSRVACDPDVLRDDVAEVIAEIAEERGLTIKERQTQSFRPGRPVPTHRLQPSPPDIPPQS
ncbi:GTP-binding protein [Planctomicrobium sp. SH668]|uniref:GTP-binding protein n=1 Tax=Planctomicrobium sp. SH668 TaxID=3448126 RepID=UPI003F5C6E43